MAHEGIGVVDRHGTPTDHTNRRVFERRTEASNSSCFGNNICADQHYHRTGSLFQEQVDGRGFAFTFLLYTQTYSWFLESQLSHNGNGAVGTTTSHDDHFLNTHGWVLLCQDSPYGALNIGFFIIGHNTDTTVNVFIVALLQLMHVHGLCFI